jgi:hypothetical protein
VLQQYYVGKDKNYFRQLSKIWNYFLDLRVTLCNFGFAELTMHSEMKRKTSFPFAFLSFFRNFATMLLIGVFPSGHVEADEASQEGDDFIARDF